MSSRIADQFWSFASTISIPSRDYGLVPFRPWGTQRYLINELISGIEEDLHDAIVLKPRQVGASTAMVVFDAFWLLRNKGLQGALIAEEDASTAFFRSLFSEVIRGIPRKWSYPLRANNRVQTLWASGSRLLYMSAGKTKATLGQGKGLNYLHATEVGSWGNVEGIQKLRAALSERHPTALYVWESTARGFNHFYEMWKSANRSTTEKAIFIPWWRHELYRVERDTKQFQVYWGRKGKLTNEEAAWQREVTRRWSVELRPEQWAWYRWKLAEKISSEIMMMQEFPTLPQHAFQASGFGFLGAASMEQVRKSLGDVPPPQCYRYTFSSQFENTDITEVGEPLAYLKVWEEPREGCHYVIAADPAFGASPDSDNYCCTVWRAERNRLVQVAEFCTNEITITQFAWVCMHLAGSYTVPYFILELNGPGMAVWQEIQRLMAWGWGTSRHAKLENVLGAIQHYIWRRPDSIGAGAAWQWKTTPQSKTWIMSRLRDQIITGRVVVRSNEMVEELAAVRQDGERFAAEGDAHDDRVITAALAVESWAEQVAPMLTVYGPDANPEDKPIELQPAHQRAVVNFFAGLNKE